MTHMRTPWFVVHYGERENGKPWFVALKYGSKTIANFCGNIADAEYAAIAVNNHEALMAALETLISESCQCCSQYDGESGCNDICDVITNAKAALEAARGKK